MSQGPSSSADLEIVLGWGSILGLSTCINSLWLDMWRTEGWLQPNFLLSADVLKTTKAMFKIWNVKTSVFLQKNSVVFFLLNASQQAPKSGWLTLYFYHGPITGRIFLEYIVQSCMTSDQNQNIPIAHADILYPCSLLFTLTTESDLTTGSGYICLGFLGGSVGKEFACNRLIPWWGRYPGEGNGYPPSFLAWRIPWTEGPGGL